MHSATSPASVLALLFALGSRSVGNQLVIAKRVAHGVGAEERKGSTLFRTDLPLRPWPKLGQRCDGSVERTAKGGSDIIEAAYPPSF